MRKPLIVILLVVAAGIGSAATPAPVLTPDGYGPLRIGMREGQVEKFLAPMRPDQKALAGADWDACHERGTVYPGLSVMVEAGRVTRLSLFDRSKIRTDKGLGLGSSEASVRKAYRKLSVHTAPYLERPALEMIAWTVKGRKGIRHDTGANRRVTTVHAGGASITYIENCL